MKRKTNTTPSKIYTFRCRVPENQEDIKYISDTLYRANKYYNDLVEIENQRRKEYKNAESLFFKDISDLNEKIKTIDEEIVLKIKSLNDLRGKERKRIKNPELQQTIKDLKNKKRILFGELKDKRKVLKNNDSFKEIEKKINDKANSNVNLLRNKSGLYWGTYLLIEKNFEAAKSSGKELKFKFFRGDGRIGVQLQKRLICGIEQCISIQGIFDHKSNFLQMDPIAFDAYIKPSGGKDKKYNKENHYIINGSSWKNKQKTKVRIRVDSLVNPKTNKVGMTPKWLEFDVVIHREIPKDAIVKWAWINIYKVGRETRYELQLTLESEKFSKPIAVSEQNIYRSIDLGWRKLNDESVRVGYFYDSNGNNGDYKLSDKIVKQFERADSLRSINEKIYNQAKQDFSSWIKQFPQLIPTWMKDENDKFHNISNLHLWKSPKHLASIAGKFSREIIQDNELKHLWNTWKNMRLSSKSDLMDSFETICVWADSQNFSNPEQYIAIYIEWWRKKNKHLRDWEFNLRDKAISNRNNTYRVWASELRNLNYKIILEDFDMRKVSSNANPEDDSTNSNNKHLKSIIAPSIFRQYIKEVVGASNIIEEDCSYTSKICTNCKTQNEYNKNKERELMLKCNNCGEIEDRDYRASFNLTKSVCERLGDEFLVRSARYTQMTDMYDEFLERSFEEVGSNMTDDSLSKIAS